MDLRLRLEVQNHETVQPLRFQFLDKLNRFWNGLHLFGLLLISFIYSIADIAYEPETLPRAYSCSGKRKQVVLAMGLANLAITLWKGLFFTWNVATAETYSFVFFLGFGL